MPSNGGARRRVGQATKLTPDIAKAICGAVQLGVPLRDACECAELSEMTVYEWVRRGEGRDDRPSNALYAKFATDLKKARGLDRLRRVKRIEEAASGGKVLARTTKTVVRGEEETTTVQESFTAPQWTADAWHLERSDPEHWGRDRGELVELRREIVALREKLEAIAGAPAAAPASGPEPRPG